MAFQSAPAPPQPMGVGIGDMDMNIASASIPQSNLPSSAQQHPLHDQAWKESQNSFPGVDSMQYSPFAAHQHQHQHQQLQHPNAHFSHDHNDFSASDFPSNDFQSDFFGPAHDGEAFQGLHFGNMGENHGFGHGFEPFPPCDDCSSTNPATIPHHHHKTGRLAGAAPQLDGHYCCRWLIHDQPCLSCFSSAEDLDNHIKSDHAGKDGTYRCLWQDCQKVDKATNTIQPVNFGNKPKLMRHVHSHTGYKPFPCPYPDCDKGFVTKEQLRNHETTHTKTRKHTCDQCGKAFAVKSALTTHITAVHEERKIHKCDMCGKAFADSSNLSKHKQTHWKSNGVTKRRSTTSKRETSDGNSTRTSPSIATPTQPPATPVVGVSGMDDQHDAHARKLPIPFISPSDSMLPPLALNKMSPGPHQHGSFMPSHHSHPSPHPAFYGTHPSHSTRANSTISSSSFDPSCYCCEQNCPQPDYCCDQNCPPPPPDFDEATSCPASSAATNALSTLSSALGSNTAVGLTEYCCDAEDCAPGSVSASGAQPGNGGSAIAVGEYCCEGEDCAPPAGPATPCTASHLDECDQATFCDLPGCLDGPAPAPAPSSGGAGAAGAKLSRNSAGPTAAEESGEVLLNASEVEALRHFQMPSNAVAAAAAVGGGTGE